METSVWADRDRKPILEPSLYHLSGDNLAFFKEQTGIQDEEELKRHVFDVQAKAYEIYGYPCIRHFTFLDTGMAQLPGYKQALALLEKDNDAILLEVGCCLGVDLRKAVADGWPVANVIGSDLYQAFWDLGHLLFKSSPQSFPAGFVAGDIFDFAVVDPRSGRPKKDLPLPALKELRCLSPLLSSVSAIHATCFFHLFSEEQQRELARRLLSLLKPRAGSLIFGLHCGLENMGFFRIGNTDIFCHSPDSWKKLWIEVFSEAGYGAEQVQVDAEVVALEAPSIIAPVDEAPVMKYAHLMWSVMIK